MTGLSECSARELSAMLAEGQLSATELMRDTLDRIADVNGTLNAIVSLCDEDSLMQEAAAADRRSRAGWLHGIPLAVKDLVYTKGIQTTLGSPVFADFVPDKDDLLAERLRAEGAILIGKTNTPEFGLGSNTFNPVHGRTCNPYDTSRSCGGSSGGAAVALASRMVSVADGSDMMGSLRNPAAWNNVYGMRPSFGLVPDEPHGDVFLHPLSTSGPMARDPLDLSYLLQTLAGPDPRQPWGREFNAAKVPTEMDIRGSRIGWLGDWGGAYAFEDGILEVCEAALETFNELGATVVPLPPPHPSEELWESWTTLRSWAVAARLEPVWTDPDSRTRLKEDARWEIERGRAFSAMELHSASRTASVWYQRCAELFASYDTLVLPSAQVWPFAADCIWPSMVAGRQMDTYHRWMEVTVPVSLIGLPTVALPAGFGSHGLPMGIQAFGPRGGDAKILGLAQAYHSATDWPGKRPPDIGSRQ